MVELLQHIPFYSSHHISLTGRPKARIPAVIHLIRLLHHEPPPRTQKKFPLTKEDLSRYSLLMGVRQVFDAAVIIANYLLNGSPRLYI
ncbi:hypothetical protein EVAR_12215_1 [Eumeta japonica]|uniref:Uncharacterized protein n=1 Tax=Eumeta variegata TaxID=151549 RepID=A0A4C1UH54_EUMVA|nr:hypothetical protein EVAR_12215_1 [Eumeta japonica]